MKAQQFAVRKFSTSMKMMEGIKPGTEQNGTRSSLALIFHVVHEDTKQRACIILTWDSEKQTLHGAAWKLRLLLLEVVYPFEIQIVDQLWFWTPPEEHFCEFSGRPLTKLSKTKGVYMVCDNNSEERKSSQWWEGRPSWHVMNLDDYEIPHICAPKWKN